ncbi:flocculation protein FLO11 [Impatiens glandulifera]|uniref:flocculation protein FLO11 n=1 Tax=Impatiens glandulifera TaxID=253017 RepID=UPI001FB16316|nr:flocculation protein FLO11 [Impatiens glandulifera]
MNRSLKEFSTGGRNVPVGALHRRGLSLNGMSKDSDDNKLDLFSKNRRSLSVVSSDESDVSVKLGRLSVGSVKLTRNGAEDLLTSTDGGKHDYDWLLTPPETPLFPSSDGSDTRASLASSRKSLSRSSSTAKASRLSVSHSESNHASSRPVRSSSVTRPSVSSSQYSSYTNKSSSILNTSSASVSSYTTRPSTPTRSSSSITRPSTPSGRSVSSRSSTPSRTRPGPPSSSMDRTTKPSQTSRPSTPSSSRSQIPATLNSIAPRAVSRPSTPTRRNPPPTLSSPTTTSALSPSNGRYLTNGQPARTSISRPSSPSSRAGPTAPSSRPSSPSSRSRPTVPLILPDFLLDVPPNLRTTLPDRPLSAGRSRPGSVSKVSLESPPTPANLTRRQSSPILNRGRLTETNTRGRANGNGQATDGFESRKVGYVSDSSLTSRKPIKSSNISSAMESTGFGRNISKKSMDMAMRHMDIRNGTTTSNNIRSLTGSSLFPQSIRSANNNNKGQSTRAYSHNSNGNLLSPYDNGHIMENSDYINRYPENGFENSNGNGRLSSARMSHEPDIYESSRYDAILLKEDLKNTNWLHSIDDKSDQSSIFDHGFELLPEPFDPL